MVAIVSRLEEIETFVAIAELGTLTAVSNRTGLALSAVSRRLKELEIRLGCTLVQRTTRRLRLTEDGHEFYRRCRHILDELQLAEGHLRDRAERLSGTIRLTAPASFARLHLSDLLAGFLEAHPDVRCEMDLSDRRVDLLDEGFDLGVRIGTLEDSTLVARRLTRIRHVPCASPRLLAKLGNPERPEDLANYPALAYRARGTHAVWRFKRPDGSSGAVSVPARLRTNNGDLLCQQAAAGLGVILEPTFLSAGLILDGRLQPMFADHVWSENAAFAIYPKAQALPRRVRALVDHLVQGLTPDPPWDRDLREAFPDIAWLPT